LIWFIGRVSWEISGEKSWEFVVNPSSCNCKLSFGCYDNDFPGCFCAFDLSAPRIAKEQFSDGNIFFIIIDGNRDACIKGSFVNAFDRDGGSLCEKFVVFLQEVAGGGFANYHLYTGWQELCVSDASQWVFEEMGCQLAQQFVMVGGTCNADGIGHHMIGRRSMDNFHRETLKHRTNMTTSSLLSMACS